MEGVVVQNFYTTLSPAISTDFEVGSFLIRGLLQELFGFLDCASNASE